MSNLLGGCRSRTLRRGSPAGPREAAVRVAEKHLTVLADRTEEGVLIIRLVDEDRPHDIVGVHVGPGDEPVLNLALDIAKLIGT